MWYTASDTLLSSNRNQIKLRVGPAGTLLAGLQDIGNNQVTFLAGIPNIMLLLSQNEIYEFIFIQLVALLFGFILAFCDTIAALQTFIYAL